MQTLEADEVDYDCAIILFQTVGYDFVIRQTVFHRYLHECVILEPY